MLTLAGPLPPLREDLALLPGPALADGQPSHTLHDPARNLFFQIDWPSVEVLRRWSLGRAEAIAQAISAETALQMAPEEVDAVAAFLRDNQLLQPPPGAAATLARQRQARHGSWWQMLLHHYLFFRVPLLRPDAWLTRWAPRLGWLFSPAFVALTAAALGWGLLEVYRQWDRFTATFVDTLTWRGLAAYGVTLGLAKALHELGHAFTAKRLGCRVPTMGLAFLVMVPVAYTDTNEVWKLPRRRDRVAVAAAGMLTELALAAWATLAWALLPDGDARTGAFLLATTTWVATLAVNLSPFMRFDGYFLLADTLGLPNLHSRAFALARWHLRERLFDLGEPPPEAFAPRRRAGLIAFAYATWAYRLVVFLGIAALVYTFFIKAVGVLLFAVEIGWFVLLPLARELAAWRALWPRLRRAPRTRWSALLLAALVLAPFLPWPSRPSAGALLRPAAQFVVYAPAGAQLQALPVAEGQTVRAGAPLLRLAAPDLGSRIEVAEARVQRLRWQASAGGLDPEQRAQWQTGQEQLLGAEAELATLQADAARYAPLAPFDGQVRDVQPELRVGDWLAAREPLLRVVANGGPTVVAYLDAEAVARIAVGDAARFYTDGGAGPVVRLEVAGIDADASRTLPEPELSTLFGGRLQARERNGQFYTEQPVYRVSFKVLDAPEEAGRHIWRGTVVVAGRASAPAWPYLRAALALLRREAGF